jgi:hypothetical protein
MLVKPHSASVVHHHGGEGTQLPINNTDPLNDLDDYKRQQFDNAVDTIIYAVGGRGAVFSKNGKKRQELAPGDFALIPAYVRRSCSWHHSCTDSSRLSTKKSTMAMRTLNGSSRVVVAVRSYTTLLIGVRAKSQQRYKAIIKSGTPTATDLEEKHACRLPVLYWVDRSSWSQHDFTQLMACCHTACTPANNLITHSVFSALSQPFPICFCISIILLWSVEVVVKVRLTISRSRAPERRSDWSDIVRSHA